MDARAGGAAIKRFVASPLGHWSFAGALVIVAEIEAVVGVAGPEWRRAVAAAIGLGFLFVGLRRRSPLVAMAVLCALVLIRTALLKLGAWETLAETLALFVISYSAGANSDRRKLLPSIALPVVVTALVDTLWPGQFSVGEGLPFVALFLVGLPALAGQVVRDRSRLIGSLRERSQELEAERAVRANQALVEERAHIRRELHQVVTSTVHQLLAQIGGGVCVRC